MTRLLFFIQLPICRRWSYLITETSNDNYGEQIGGRVRSKPVGDMQKISPRPPSPRPRVSLNQLLMTTP